MSNSETVSVMTHLDELRKRLTIIVAVNIGAAIILFNKASVILDYFLAINPGMQLVYITPSELLGVFACNRLSGVGICGKRPV